MNETILVGVLIILLRLNNSVRNASFEFMNWKPAIEIYNKVIILNHPVLFQYRIDV